MTHPTLHPTWRHEVRPTLTLSFPLMAGMLGQMLIGLADTIMVGKLGDVPLAAAGFVSLLFHLPLVFGIGLLSSVAVLAAQAFGADRKREVGEVLRHGLGLSIGIGCLLAGVVGLMRLWLDRFGQTAEVVNASKVYVLQVGVSILPVLIQMTMKQFGDSLNRPWPTTFIMLGGVALNVFLNWVFIYGNLGAPRLELVGAGWATIIARSAIAIATVGFIVCAPGLRLFQPRHWWCALDWDVIKRLLHLGAPVGFQHLMEVSAFVFAGLMMGWIGEVALASHQIAINCAATTFMVPLGIAMAVSIRVGHAWGAQSYPRVRRIGYVGGAMATLLMGLAAILFITAGEPIARVFTDPVKSPEVVALTARLLFVAAFFQIVDGIQVVGHSALRGMSDVRIPACIALFAYWGVAIPMGYVLAFQTPVGAPGIWVGLATGLGIAAASFAWRFHRKSVIPAFTKSQESADNT